MSEKMAVEVMERIPISIVIHMLLGGAILILLSPIRFASFPISGFINSSDNILNNLIVFSVISLIAGIPLLLIKDLISADNGLNSKINKKLFDRNKDSLKNEGEESLVPANLNITRLS